MTARVQALSICVLAAVAFACPGTGQAATYSWSFNGSSNFTGSGTLETGAAEPNNGVLITGITGTWDGFIITGLLPTNTFQNNDNILYPDSSPQLDSGGFAFSDSEGQGFFVKIGFTTLNQFISGYSAFQTEAGSTTCQNGVCTVEPGAVVSLIIGGDSGFSLEPVTPSAVPVPGAFALFSGGLGVLGLLGWRRKRKGQAA